MRATLRWAGPAALFVFAVGCGHEAPSAKKASGGPNARSNRRMSEERPDVLNYTQQDS